MTTKKQDDLFTSSIQSVGDLSDESQEIINKKENIDSDRVVPESRRDFRSLAFHFIYAMDQFEYSVSLESIIDNFKRGFDLEIEDDSFAIEMARGVIALRDELDEEMKPLLKNWRIERLSCCTRLILRMAIWELKKKDSPSSVVINEAIELAKGFAEKDAYKFINGVLDEYIKLHDLVDKKEEVGEQDEEVQQEDSEKILEREEDQE